MTSLNGGCYIFAILFLQTMQTTSWGKTSGSPSTLRFNVSGIVGHDAQLPCDAEETSDLLLLVIWFKEPDPNPIYSYDVRGKGIQRGRHWNDGLNLGPRARFDEKASPMPVLWIENLKEEDQGSYRCRVDLRQKPTKNFLVDLRVIVPPGRPRIQNEKGIEVNEKLGPYNEGEQLELTCSVSGGNPRPSLYWMINGRRAPLEQERVTVNRDIFMPTSNSTMISSTLHVGVLQRRHVDSIYTCLASNSNMTQASTFQTKLQMNLLPLHVHIPLDRKSLSAQTVYDIPCSTFGSRPQAFVTWWLGNTQLLDHSSALSPSGNNTLSNLRFQPKASDQGKILRCRSENPILPASQIEDTWILDINHLPFVKLRLGATINENNIKEGDDVYFECNVDAKPKALHLEWELNGDRLRQNLQKGILIGNQSLVLQNLSKDNTGTYKCIATNEEGTTTSNGVRLDVKYKPICSAHQKVVYGVAHGEIASINCTVLSNPRENLTFKWTFNSSSELNVLPRTRFKSKDSTSTLVYSLNTGRDYGTILCWAKNSLGIQQDPCMFHLIPAVVPSSPHHCDLLNQTSTEVTVVCHPGFDGGLPQKFVLGSSEEAFVLNQTSRTPRFQVNGLLPNTSYTLYVSAVNAKGESKKVTLKGRSRPGKNTLSNGSFDLRELNKQSTTVVHHSIINDSENKSHNSLYAVFGGIVCGLGIIIAVVLWTLRCRLSASQRNDCSLTKDCDIAWMDSNVYPRVDNLHNNGGSICDLSSFIPPPPSPPSNQFCERSTLQLLHRSSQSLPAQQDRTHVGAVALDFTLFDGIADLEYNMLIPPPAECLYTLPRQKKQKSISRSKLPTESVV